MGFLLLNAGFIVGVVVIGILSRTGVRKSRWFGLVVGARVPSGW